MANKTKSLQAYSGNLMSFSFLNRPKCLVSYIMKLLVEQG